MVAMPLVIIYNADDNYESHCPSGLVFYSDRKVCDLPSSECGFATDTPVNADSVAQSSATLPPNTQMPIDSGPIDCSTRRDGVYGRPCANTFIYCSNSRPQSMNCPSGLLFNAKILACDFPSSECSISTAPAFMPTLAVPVAADSNTDRPWSKSVQTLGQTEAHQQQQEPPVVDCSVQKDGVYGVHCSPTFMQCSNGKPFVMVCPNGLVFDDQSSKCDFPKLQCQNQASSSIISLEPTVKSLIETTQTPQTEPHSVPGSAVDCSKLPTGDYSLGCFTEYVTCLSGTLIRRFCPQGLVFSERRRFCVWPQECVESEGSMDCSYLPDGLYGGSCSTVFAECSNSKAKIFKCPSGLLFDALSRQCEYPSDTCMSVIAPRPFATTQPTASAGPMDASAMVDSSPSHANDVAFDCAHHSDGDYSLGCASRYITCIGGIAHIRYCPSKLVYDSIMKQCVWPEQCRPTAAQQMPTGQSTFMPQPSFQPTSLPTQLPSTEGD
ncbi:unnamed protein product, partial [Anisakis simplex]|uniref:Chondroitin proteoglycan 2 n=1 Tax=Anisakis simplex TaxID=6269 RepID=A0A0M3J3H2_ANISI